MCVFLLPFLPALPPSFVEDEGADTCETKHRLRNPYADFCCRRCHGLVLVAGRTVRSRLSLLFLPSSLTSASTHHSDLWIGTSLGTLLSFDLSPLLDQKPSSSRSSSPLHHFSAVNVQLPRTAYRQDAHLGGSAILKIAHIRHEHGDRMYTIDASGRVVVWLESPAFFVGESPNLHGHTRVFQLDASNSFPALAPSSSFPPPPPPAHPANPPPPLTFVEVINGLIWTCWNVHPTADGKHKQVLVKVYDASGTKLVVKGSQHWSTGSSTALLLGGVTSACVVPSKPKFVFLGHECVAFLFLFLLTY